MFIRLHYKQNMLEVLGLDANALMTVELKNGATEVVLKNGLFYVVSETPDEVIALVNRALQAETQASSAPAQEAGK